MNRLAQNLLLGAAATGLALAATEVGLRLVVGRQEHARELRSMLERSRAATPAPGAANASLRGLIQSSGNDRIVYEMKPGLRATFIGVPVAINQAGFRERELPAAKPPGTFRIVGLGDSVMFGWGVPVEATYLRVLEALLQARGDPVRYGDAQLRRAGLQRGDGGGDVPGRGAMGRIWWWWGTSATTTRSPTS